MWGRMLKLAGAEELRQLVLKKRGYKIVRRSVRKQGEEATYRSFVVRFPCPVCAGSAYEEYEERRYGEFIPITDVQSFAWSSACGHVIGQADHFRCVIPVQQNGKVVGWVGRDLIGHDGFWHRLSYEDGKMAESPPVRFGTMWQALKASPDECRLLAMMQQEDKSRD